MPAMSSTVASHKGLHTPEVSHNGMLVLKWILLRELSDRAHLLCLLAFSIDLN